MNEYTEYQRQNWYNLPDQSTPVSADRINHIEEGLLKASQKIIEVDNKYIIGAKLLWTNPNPDSSIASATTITLIDDDYDMYKVIYKHTNTSSRLLSVDSIKGYSCVLQTNASGMIFRRFIDYNSPTSYTISTENGGQSNNNTLIPLYIVGYKTGLF